MDVKRDNGTRWEIQTGAILLNFVISKPNITFCVYCYQRQCQKTSTNSKYCRKQEIWKKNAKEPVYLCMITSKIRSKYIFVVKKFSKDKLDENRNNRATASIAFFLNLFVCCFFLFFSKACSQCFTCVLLVSVLGIIIHHWQKQTRSAWAINWSEKSDVPQLIVRTEKTRLVRYLLYLWVQTEGERLNLNEPHS